MLFNYNGFHVRIFFMESIFVFESEIKRTLCVQLNFVVCLLACCFAEKRGVERSQKVSQMHCVPSVIDLLARDLSSYLFMISPLSLPLID